MLLTLLAPQSGSGSPGTVAPAAVQASVSIPAPSWGEYADIVQPPILQETGADDATYNSAAFTSTQTWQWTGTSTNSSTGAWTGFRFKIPASIDRTTITDVRLVLTTLDGAGGTATTAIRVEQGPAAQLSSSGARRPDTLWASIGAGSGDTAQVAWTHVGAAADATNTSPNISAAVVAALASINQSTEYLNVMIGPTGSSTSRYRTFSHDDSTPARRPQLLVTARQLVNPTPTVAPVNAATSIPTPTSTPPISIAYTNGTALTFKDLPNSAPGGRNLSLWLPNGTAPETGWPLFMWIHGGFFSQGSRSEIPSSLVNQLLDRGIAVVSVDYRLTEAIAGGAFAEATLSNGNEASFPLGIHDVKVALRFFRRDKLESNLYNIDTDNTIISGHSAGTSIAQFVAFTKGDTTTYSGIYPGSWPAGDIFNPNRHQRPAHVGRSNGAPNTSYPFDFGQNGDTITASGNSLTLNNSYTIKGMFLFAPVVSPQNAVNPTLTPNGSNRIVISLGRRYLVSRSGHAISEASIDTTVYGELDVDKYINPASGSPTINEPYRGKAAVVPDFPIGIVFGTADDLTTKAAHYDQLVTALTNVGYVTGPPTPGVISSEKLTYFELAGVDHEGAKTNATGIANFFSWLDAFSDVIISPESVAATSSIPAPTWGSGTLPTAVAAVTAILQPLINSGTLPTAVAAVSAIPAPGWGQQAVPSSVTAVTTISAPAVSSGATASVSVVASISTIPAPGWGAGPLPTAVAATSSITAPTWGSGTVPAAVAAIAAIPSPTTSSGATAPASVVAAVTAIPASLWGAGLAPAVVTATAAIPAPGVSAGISLTPSVVAATATIPAPSWGAGTLPTSVGAAVSVPEPSWVTGTMVGPSAVAAVAAVPTPLWGSGIAAGVVAVVSSAPTPALSMQITASIVAAGTSVPAPSVISGGAATPSAVGTTAGIPAPFVSAQGTAQPLPAVATSQIPVPILISGSRLVPSGLQVSASIPTPTRKVNVVPAVVVASAAIPAPAATGQWIVSASTVSANSSLPTPLFGSGVVLSAVVSFAVVPEPQAYGPDWLASTQVVAVLPQLPTPRKYVLQPVVLTRKNLNGPETPIGQITWFDGTVETPVDLFWTTGS